MGLLPHLAARVLNTPLLITPEYGAVIASVLADRIGIEPMVDAATMESYHRPASSETLDRRSGIMTVPITGGLVHRSDGPTASGGMHSYTNLHNRIEGHFANRDVRGILLDIDSSGGEAAGLSELVEWLPKAAAQAGKPVWAIANTTAASAAYWLAASADRLYAAPQANVGSIGVYIQHLDMSKSLEKRGVAMSFIYAGDHKIDGNPFAPLPDDVRAAIQSRVDALYADFVGGVASLRGIDEQTVRSTQARVYRPQEAYDLGLIDGIGGYGDVLAAFSAHLNRPRVGFTGENMSTKLLYGEDDLANARAEGAETAKAGTITQAAADTAVATARKETADAMLALAPDNERLTMFVEALADGGSIALSSKLASKIPAPAVVPAASGTATDQAVQALLTAHAPNVSVDGGNALPGDAKAARLAEIQSGAKAFNKAKGYSA